MSNQFSAGRLRAALTRTGTGTRTTAFAAVTALGLATLAACGSAANADDPNSVDIVGYSVLEQANAGVIKDFQSTEAGKGVTFKESYGASGDQARAVISGQKADEVHLSLEPDVAKLVDAGLVSKSWKANSTKGICTSSVVVLVVRKDNPKNIKTWDDLVKPGVGIVTPNPASSGSAKWNLLAAYGHVLATGGTTKGAQAYMTKFFKNTVALPDSGRDATTAFEGGNGDVLLSYENEAILAIQGGADFTYVVPPQTLLIQNPCALVNGAPKAAKDFMAFQKSKEGQKDYAETGYRPIVDVGTITVKGANDPSNPYPQPSDKLETVDGDFGGWDAANTKFFDEDNGVLTKIQAAAGK
jgi:sulfate/thiosulfate transport system substrate-binding protein